MKKRNIISAATALALLWVQAANASCFADYKAKQDSPLRLHYGVISLPSSVCSSKSAAKKTIAKKISRDDWTLLTVIGLFDESGLGERKNSAGAYYLKY